MKEKIKAIKANFFISNIVYVLLSGLIVRIVLSGFGTLHLDQGTFMAWSKNLVDGGLNSFYNSWSDYFPGYLYVLWLLGKVTAAVPWFPQVLLYKVPAILADLITGFLIYKILRKIKSEKWALIGSAIYIFNPAILANSALWGQVDSLTALFSLLTVYLLPFTYFLSAISFAIGTLIKPQTLFIAPVILYLMLKEKWKFNKILVYWFIGLLVFIGLFIPFWNKASFISFLLTRIGVSLNQYPYTSINAFNFWGIVGFWKPDNLYFQVAGYLFVLTVFSYLAIKISKLKFDSYYLLSFIFAASFIFFTRMHERHLLPVFAPLAIVAIENPLLLIPYTGFSIIYLANLYYSYIWVSYEFKSVFPDLLLKLFSLVNSAFVVFIFYSLVKRLKFTFHKFLLPKSSTPAYKLSEVGISKQKIRIILGLILTFAFLTRIFDLGSPKNDYFDEVYHAFTARTILHNDPKAWEWWNTPPEGFAYEWTHPPIAKLGMVIGMKIFGENSFGWRIPGALLGLGSVFLIYLIAKTLFNDEVVGILSAGVFSLDGLALVMSRIGMNDSYLLFFVLISIYCFIKNKNLFSALFFGMALASKWSAIWAIPILFILWLRRKNKFSVSLFLSFIILPFTIYLLSYLPMFLTGHGLDIWWGMQKQMWWYHTGLDATHPYQSLWWTWPFLIRPIYLYTSDEVRGWVARIYAFGNPFVFWFGLSSVILAFIYSFMERNKTLALVVFSYFIFFVPWALSPRIMFLYHYLPSIPFLAIATGYVLRRNPKLIIGYTTVCLLAFIYFYPHWAGLQIPLWLDKIYYWVSSWR